MALKKWEIFQNEATDLLNNYFDIEFKSDAFKESYK